MATRRQVQRRAAALGCRVIINSERGERLDCEVEAPPGYHFAGDGLHCLVGSQWPDEKAADVYDDLLDRMEGGVAPCSEGGCNGDCRNGALQMLGIQQGEAVLRVGELMGMVARGDR